jgi:hypothetical protein
VTQGGVGQIVRALKAYEAQLDRTLARRISELQNAVWVAAQSLSVRP